ncbi:MAG: hypothetical protein AAB425_06505 [Bdellovibrionota bacterium]
MTELVGLGSVKEVSRSERDVFFDVWGANGKTVRALEVHFDLMAANTAKGIHRVTVHIPKSRWPWMDLWRVREARKVLANLPKGFEWTHDEIFFSPRMIHQAAVAMTERPDPELENRLLRTHLLIPKVLSSAQDRQVGPFWHETGHQIVFRLRSRFTPGPQWRRAMVGDGGAVSSYATKDTGEDFAETVQVYLESDAGRLDPQLRVAFKHRFEYLDQIFSVPEHSRLAREAWDRALRRRRIVMLGAGAVGLGSAGWWYATTTSRSEKNAERK